jgi:hypothetical protein
LCKRPQDVDSTSARHLNWVYPQPRRAGQVWSSTKLSYGHHPKRVLRLAL